MTTHHDRTHRSDLLDQLRESYGPAPFHASDAAAHGISRDRVERACRKGRLHRLGRGWYALSDSGDARDVRLSKLQRENSGVVACGRTAARIWGMPVPASQGKEDDLEIAYVEGHSGQYGRRQALVARRWSVPPDQVTHGPSGHLATDPLRTALDLARGLPLHWCLVPLDSALSIVTGEGFDVAEVREALNGYWRGLRGGRGIRSIGPALEHAHPLAESPLESIVRGRIIKAGLPTPDLQVIVTGASGRSYRADMGLDLPGDSPGTHRLLIEADGLGKYTRPEDLAREKMRQHDLECKGHEFIRVVYHEALHSPGRFLSAIDRRVNGCA